MSENENQEFNPTKTILEKEIKDGAHLNLDDLTGENGSLTKVAPVSMSLMHRMYGVDDDFRVEIKTGNYANTDEGDRLAMLYWKLGDMGLKRACKLIELLILARKAGKNGAYARELQETLNHSSYTIDQRNHNDKRKSKDSPLSS